MKQELQVIDDFASSWETDLRELPSEDETQVEYHPKEYFGDEFQERIDKMLKEALTECAYDNLTTARFNMSDFDVEVNGRKKANFNGQGYNYIERAHPEKCVLCNICGVVCPDVAVGVVEE